MKPFNSNGIFRSNNKKIDFRIVVASGLRVEIIQFFCDHPSSKWRYKENLLQVHIDGPYQIQTNQYYQFEALTDGGYWPYSWQRQIDYGNGSSSWQNVGGDSYSYTHISYNQQDFYLRVQVTDAQNETKTSTIHPVMVSSGGAASQDTSLGEDMK